jgi:hypothetical protein
VGTAKERKRPIPPRKLTGKLERWHTLGFDAFREVRSDVPVKERRDWGSYLAENAAEVNRLTSVIEIAEREIDSIYDLFALTQDEIGLLESSLAARR